MEHQSPFVGMLEQIQVKFGGAVPAGQHRAPLQDGAEARVGVLYVIDRVFDGLAFGLFNVKGHLGVVGAVEELIAAGVFADLIQ